MLNERRERLFEGPAGFHGQPGEGRPEFLAEVETRQSRLSSPWREVKRDHAVSLFFPLFDFPSFIEGRRGIRRYARARTRVGPTELGHGGLPPRSNPPY